MQAVKGVSYVYRYPLPQLTPLFLHRNAGELRIAVQSNETPVYAIANACVRFTCKPYAMYRNTLTLSLWSRSIWLIYGELIGITEPN